MIKVLIVDDSAFMRSALTRMLSEDPDIEVVGTARDGEDGLEKVKKLDPDLITLDVEMPRLDGLGMLERLMKTTPKPVLMVSSLTSEGVEGTKVLKQKGGWIIAQNEASCVVYGMPKAVVDAGLADEVVELDLLADTIQNALYR